MAKARRAFKKASGKSAYKLTARRKAALKRAQLISARKRKGRGGNSNVKAGAVGAGVGILAVTGVGAAYYAGTRMGKKDVAGSVAGHTPAQATQTAAKANDVNLAVSPEGKEAVRAAGAVSPPKPKVKVIKTPGIKQRKTATAGAAGTTDAPADSPGAKEKIPTVIPKEQALMMGEALKPNGPSVMDPNSFNLDGTVTPNLTDQLDQIGVGADGQVAGKDVWKALYAERRKRAKTGVAFDDADMRQAFKNATGRDPGERKGRGRGRKPAKDNGGPANLSDQVAGTQINDSIPGLVVTPAGGPDAKPGTHSADGGIQAALDAIYKQAHPEGLIDPEIGF